ncbi:hypothetical protein SLS62_007446 [Diatrype stigma]|uniref:DEUBAD domain-containing protein n=1 Tax=Diatrype stigma TaxID=117547 RepID=A0AAN9UWN9_9PEZI
MPPRKKRSAEAIVAPTRRSTRTRNPSKVATKEGTGDSPPQKRIARDAKASGKASTGDEILVSVATQDEVVVHRPREPSESTVVAAVAAVAATVAETADSVNKSAQFSRGDDGGASSSEKAAENPMPPQADVNMEDSEDKIIAHSSSPKAATRTPIKSRKYVAEPADREEDELATEQPAIKIVKVSDSARKSRSKYDKPEEMLTNTRSPLVNARLRDLLCSSRAWDLLSPEERKRVLAKFPDQREILDAGTEEARPNVAALRNNNNFRHDIARYQDNLGKGKHDPEWIRQAQDAHRKRESGMYTEYLASRFEEDWGMQMPGLAEEGGGGGGGEEAGAREGPGAEVEMKTETEAQAKEEQPAADAVKHVPSDMPPGAGDAGETAKPDQEMTAEPGAKETHNTTITGQAEEVTAATTNDQEMAEEANSAAPSDSRGMLHVEVESSTTGGVEEP